MARILILGLGNPILTDDGVGVLVAEEVRAHLNSTPEIDIDIKELSVGGLTLMESMVGYESVILIDALYRPGGTPGAYHRLKIEDLQTLSPPQHLSSAHDVTLSTAIAVGRKMGLPIPDNIILYAIEVENITDFSDRPTPLVASVVPVVAQAVINEIGSISRSDR